MTLHSPLPARGTWRRAWLQQLVITVAFTTLAVIVAVQVSNRALDRANQRLDGVAAVCRQNAAVFDTLASLLDRLQASAASNPTRTEQQNAEARQFYTQLLAVLRPAKPSVCPPPR